MQSTAKSDSARNIEYQSKNRDLGLVNVRVWIPEEKREEFLAIAEKMRQEYLENNDLLECKVVKTEEEKLRQIKEYQKKNQKRGLVTVRSWVPADRRDELLAIAEKMRAEYLGEHD